ncbi:uncharacterized protein LTR77_003331 [Saxophila tyrrhenica]|uniref:Uncharacterized protein n=1 Tax=Saxophila tyrrhenica TaxID=1690608 RepID=A0AAV9PJW2_9PEZI|nr:hypothetical protein LTR77_003331 [Saxophila tyrrhenica]
MPQQEPWLDDPDMADDPVWQLALAALKEGQETLDWDAEQDRLEAQYKEEALREAAEAKAAAAREAEAQEAAVREAKAKAQEAAVRETVTKDAANDEAGDTSRVATREGASQEATGAPLASAATAAPEREASAGDIIADREAMRAKTALYEKYREETDPEFLIFRTPDGDELHKEDMTDVICFFTRFSRYRSNTNGLKTLWDLVQAGSRLYCVAAYTKYFEPSERKNGQGKDEACDRCAAVLYPCVVRRGGKFILLPPMEIEEEEMEKEAEEQDAEMQEADEEDPMDTA